MAGAAFIFQSPKSRCHQDDGERQIAVATDRWQVEGVSAPWCPADGSWGHYLLLCSSPYPPTPLCPLSLSLSYCVNVLQRHIRSVTVWPALNVNTLLSALHHANTLGNLNCLFCCQLKLIITVFSVDVINVSLFTESQLHSPDTSDGKYSQRHSSRLKCSLLSVVEPLHFLINSKSKEKTAINGHSVQINQVNNYRQKVGQPGKKHSATAGINSWFIMLPESFYNKLCGQYGGHG